MAERRASPVAPACAADAPASSAAPASLSALPTDLLALILAFAPIRARLRTLSVVCKRWRTAGLRSVRSLSYQRLDPDAGDVLSRCLTLFPSLTKLKLRSSAAAPLPATLRSLTLSGRCQAVAFAPPTDGSVNMDNTFCTQHLRGLTKLALEVEGDATDAANLSRECNPLLYAFLARHATQLQTLYISGENFAGLLRALPSLAWPRLTRLWITAAPDLPEVLRLMALPPHVRFGTRCASVSAAFALLPHCTASLTSLSLGIHAPPTSALLELLVRATRLTSLYAPHSMIYVRHNESFFAPRLRTHLLAPDDWHRLPRYTAVRYLGIPYTCTSLPPLNGHLARLTYVELGSFSDGFDAPAAVPLVAHLIRELPRLRSVCVFAKQAAKDITEETKRALNALALAGGVQKLRLFSVEDYCHVDFEAPEGWLTRPPFLATRFEYLFL